MSSLPLDSEKYFRKLYSFFLWSLGEARHGGKILEETEKFFIMMAKHNGNASIWKEKLS